MGQALQAASQPSLRPRDCNLEKPYQSSQSFSAHGKKKNEKEKEAEKSACVGARKRDLTSQPAALTKGSAWSSPPQYL